MKLVGRPDINESATVIGRTIALLPVAAKLDRVCPPQLSAQLQSSGNQNGSGAKNRDIG
jgi:hypothetical protein